MKTKKKTKKVTVISIEILSYVLDEIYKRLDKLEKSVQGLIYTNADGRLEKLEMDARVIDLDKAELEGVDDSEEFMREELKEIRQLAEKEGDKCYKINYTVVLKDLYDGIYFKANKMLKEK